MSVKNKTPNNYHPIARCILSWYDQNKRSLPWRDNPEPYWVLLSEFMLQQTQVETVKPYFHRFISNFPDMVSLSQATDDEVMTLWAGLGYYSRARNLLKSARMINEAGSFPQTIEELNALPGVGPYVAGAIGSIALGLDTGAVDGNHHRVFSRLFCDSGNRKAMWKHAESLLPSGRAGDFNQALMDLGSSICKSKNPNCSACPLSEHCKAFHSGTTELYPARKKKKQKPTRMMISGLLRTNQGLLLCKRPNKGLFGGLFEPPTFFTETNCGDEMALAWVDNFEDPIHAADLIGTVKHTLTHMNLEVRVYRIDASEPVKSSTYTEFRYIEEKYFETVGVSTLAKKILKLTGKMTQQSLFKMGLP